VTHTTILDGLAAADYRSVTGHFAQTIMKELRLVSGYDVPCLLHIATNLRIANRWFCATVASFLSLISTEPELKSHLHEHSEMLLAGFYPVSGSGARTFSPRSRDEWKD